METVGDCDFALEIDENGSEAFDLRGQALSKHRQVNGVKMSIKQVAISDKELVVNEIPEVIQDLADDTEIGCNKSLEADDFEIIECDYDSSDEENHFQDHLPISTELKGDETIKDKIMVLANDEDSDDD